MKIINNNLIEVTKKEFEWVFNEYMPNKIYKPPVIGYSENGKYYIQNFGR